MSKEKALSVSSNVGGWGRVGRLPRSSRKGISSIVGGVAPRRLIRALAKAMQGPPSHPWDGRYVGWAAHEYDVGGISVRVVEDDWCVISIGCCKGAATMK